MKRENHNYCGQVPAQVRRDEENNGVDTAFSGQGDSSMGTGGSSRLVGGSWGGVGGPTASAVDSSSVGAAGFSDSSAASMLGSL